MDVVVVPNFKSSSNKNITVSILGFYTKIQRLEKDERKLKNSKKYHRLTE